MVLAPEPSPEGPTLQAVIVTAAACHFCGEALGNLRRLAAEFPISIRVVDIESDEGRALVQRHRPSLPPALLLDGQFVGSGPISRRKLRRLLEEATRR